MAQRADINSFGFSEEGFISKTKWSQERFRCSALTGSGRTSCWLFEGHYEPHKVENAILSK